MEARFCDIHLDQRSGNLQELYPSVRNMLGSALSSSRICRLRANWSSVCADNVRPRRASAIDCRVQRPSRRKKREAQEILDKLIERAKRDYVSPYHLAIVCTGMGDREQAFQWLEKAYQERAHYLVHIK